MTGYTAEEVAERLEQRLGERRGDPGRRVEDAGRNPEGEGRMGDEDKGSHNNKVIAAILAGILSIGGGGGTFFVKTQNELANTTTELAVLRERVEGYKKTTDTKLDSISADIARLAQAAERREERSDRRRGRATDEP